MVMLTHNLLITSRQVSLLTKTLRLGELPAQVGGWPYIHLWMHGFCCPWHIITDVTTSDSVLRYFLEWAFGSVSQSVRTTTSVWCRKSQVRIWTLTITLVTTSTIVLQVSSVVDCSLYIRCVVGSNPGNKMFSVYDINTCRAHFPKRPRA